MLCVTGWAKACRTDRGRETIKAAGIDVRELRKSQVEHP